MTNAQQIRRIGSGYYVVTDADGVDWDVFRTRDETGSYWRASEPSGGYVEAETLAEVKATLADADGRR